jgi:hypothetical protein
MARGLAGVAQLLAQRVVPGLDITVTAEKAQQFAACAVRLRAFISNRGVANLGCRQASVYLW